MVSDETIIQIKLSDGTLWQIPLKFVAEHRAKYYDQKSPGCFEKEIGFVMTFPVEGVDWLQNNMDLEDFRKALKVIQPENAELKYVDWANAPMEIIEDDKKEN
jgi:hypothetical protein